MFSVLRTIPYKKFHLSDTSNCIFQITDIFIRKYVFSHCLLLVVHVAFLYLFMPSPVERRFLFKRIPLLSCSLFRFCFFTYLLYLHLSSHFIFFIYTYSCFDTFLFRYFSKLFKLQFKYTYSICFLSNSFLFVCKALYLMSLLSHSLRLFFIIFLNRSVFVTSSLTFITLFLWNSFNQTLQDHSLPIYCLYTCFLF